MRHPDKLICVGKNYLEHAKELGDKIPEKPVIFLKPPSVMKQAMENGETLKASIPRGMGSVHHECEIVIQLKKGGYRLSQSSAMASISAVTLGLDMTLRDRQAILKENGHPWTTAKVFPDSALLGPWKKIEEFSDYQDRAFTLKIAGAVKQTATAREMMLSIPDCIAYISEHFPLCEGDIVFTGTPKGVGPISVGDRAELEFGDIRFAVLWNES